MRKMLRAGDDPRDFEDEVEESDVDVIELMKDQGIPMGEQVKRKGEGIMQLASEDSRRRKRHGIFYRVRRVSWMKTLEQLSRRFYENKNVRS